LCFSHLSQQKLSLISSKWKESQKNSLSEISLIALSKGFIKKILFENHSLVLSEEVFISLKDCVLKCVLIWNVRVDTENRVTLVELMLSQREQQKINKNIDYFNKVSDFHLVLRYKYCIKF
jgi:hypothetical protein